MTDKRGAWDLEKPSLWSSSGLKTKQKKCTTKLRHNQAIFTFGPARLQATCNGRHDSRSQKTLDGLKPHAEDLIRIHTRADK